MDYIGHLAFGINTLRVLKQNNIFIDEQLFLTGCLAPDIARTPSLPKSVTHFREMSPNLYKSPDLDRFLKKYNTRLLEPFVLGYYCHLFADEVFTNIFLYETAMPLDENYKPTHLKEKSVYVKNAKTKDIFDIRNKTKSTTLYSDYFKISTRIGEYFKIPYNFTYSLENPNMDEVDPSRLDFIQKQCEKYYNENINSLFSNKEEMETSFIDVDKYINFIETYSNKLAVNLSNMFFDQSDLKAII